MFGWNVRTIGDVTATEVTEQGVTSVAMPDLATVRTNPRTGATEYLGTVRGRYIPIQMEAHAEPLDLFARETDATFSRAGCWKGGARAYLTMRLPNALNVGGFDRHDLDLVALFPHDGSAKASIHLAPMRWICGNMQTMFIRNAVQSWSIPHTASATMRLAEVHEALTALLRYTDSFQREAERLLDTSLSLGQFEQLINRVWTPPTADHGRAASNWRARSETLVHLFENAATQVQIRGTAWAGWNAITEYLDHFAPSATDEARAQRTMRGGSAVRLKNDAYRELLTLAA